MADPVLASCHTDGTQGNLSSDGVSISADGRYVAFSSYATNLTTPSTDGNIDIFIRDLTTSTTTLVSVSTAGVEGSAASWRPSISDDGRYIAFYSFANNLVTGDGNSAGDAFVRDRTAGTTTRVSVSSAGAEANDHTLYTVISGNGRYAAFQCYATNLVSGDTNGVGDIFVHDQDTGTTTRGSLGTGDVQPDGESDYPVLSQDGRYLAFESQATNLVVGDTNGVEDIYLRDRTNGTTTRVTVRTDGTEANDVSWPEDISADGRYVVFTSDATNLVDGDTNAERDVFVWDRDSGAITRASLSDTGEQANNWSPYASISADGRYVGFVSSATNLVDGDTNGKRDAFFRDLVSGTVIRVSARSDGTEANAHAYSAAISGGAEHVAFRSAATNLAAEATNGRVQIFVSALAPLAVRWPRDENP